MEANPVMCSGSSLSARMVMSWNLSKCSATLEKSCHLPCSARIFFRPSAAATVARKLTFFVLESSRTISRPG